MLTLLLACNGDPTGTTGTDGGVDPVENLLEPGTDLCKYEDSAPRLPPTSPVTSVGIDEPPIVYSACLDGLLDVSAEVIDGEAGRAETHDTTAAFFAIDQLPGSVESGAWLDNLDVVDDCGVLQYSVITPNDPVLRYLAAGDVTATASWGTDALTPDPSPVYTADLAADGLAAAYGEPFGWSASGGAGADATELPDVVRLPDRIEVTSPEVGPGYSLVRRFDREFDWTGTSDGTVLLILDAGDAPPYYRMQCVLHDDGSYVVPHEVMEAIPAGLPATLSMSRDADTWLGTHAGRTFHARAHAGYVATGLVTE